MQVDASNVEESRHLGSPLTSITENETRGGNQPHLPAVASDPPLNSDDQGESLPQFIGGYRILSELGRGGLGVVYLANQVSLQRNVALKVIRAGLKRNATVIARFIREAYAAAQLSHPNVVQIFDLGSDGDTHYFSMEFVPGQSLAELLKSSGRLPPEQAAGYILQAARGLQYAHNQGIVHRDIKPANLMLSTSGVVKVADLGLVKMAGDDWQPIHVAAANTARNELTAFGTTLGTASYMSPEQASDSSNVDHRTDIFALGSTFYALLAGTPPIPVADPDRPQLLPLEPPKTRIEEKIPKLAPALAQVVNRMMANRADDRYQSLAGVIQDLEAQLGVHSGQNFHPQEVDVERLERAVQGYNNAPATVLRKWLPLAFVCVCSVLLILVVLTYPIAVLPVVVFFATSVASYGLISGWKLKAHWMSRLRELVWGMKFQFAFLTLLLLLMIAIPTVALGPFAIGLTALAMIAGGTLGWTFFFVGDQALQTQRASELEEIGQMLKRMRISGVDEDSLQLFVAKFSGNDWEEIFEDVFGYRAKRRARVELARIGAMHRRNQFRPWLDGLISRIEKRLRELKRASDRRKLFRIEQASLRQQGLSATEAENQADRFIDAFISDSEEESYERSYIASPNDDPRQAVESKRKRIRQLMIEAKANRLQKKLFWKIRVVPFLNQWLGPLTRLILSAVLMICFGCWVAYAARNYEAQVSIASQQTPAWGELVLNRLGLGYLSNNEQILPIPTIGRFISGFGTLFAGCFLFLSALINGWRPTLFMMGATALLLVLPPFKILDHAALGGSLGVATILAAACLAGAFVVRDRLRDEVRM